MKICSSDPNSLTRYLNYTYLQCLRKVEFEGNTIISSKTFFLSLLLHDHRL